MFAKYFTFSCTLEKRKTFSKTPIVKLQTCQLMANVRFLWCFCRVKDVLSMITRYEMNLNHEGMEKVWFLNCQPFASKYWVIVHPPTCIEWHWIRIQPKTGWLYGAKSGAIRRPVQSTSTKAIRPWLQGFNYVWCVFFLCMKSSIGLLEQIAKIDIC